MHKMADKGYAKSVLFISKWAVQQKLNSIEK